MSDEVLSGDGGDETAVLTVDEKAVLTVAESKPAGPDGMIEQRALVSLTEEAIEIVAQASLMPPVILPVVVMYISSDQTDALNHKFNLDASALAKTSAPVGSYSGAGLRCDNY